jgi:quercetin dioxygenase-like cupin family protein
VLRGTLRTQANDATNKGEGKVMSNLKLLPFAIAGIAAAGVVATSAQASPGGGVTAETFVTGTLKGSNQQNSDKVKFQTKDDTAVRVQKLTFSAGGFTGWHHHPGIVIVTVKEGTIQMMHSDCSTHEYGPSSAHGSVFVEGEQRVHEATSAGGAVVYATYVAPDASPPVFRVENSPPFCVTTIDKLSKKP